MNDWYLGIFTQLIFKVNFGRMEDVSNFLDHVIFMTEERANNCDYCPQTGPNQFKLIELINYDKGSMGKEGIRHQPISIFAALKPYSLNM